MENTALMLTAVILAGGRARRMDGKDKGLLLLRDKPMISYVISKLTPQIQRLIINANRNHDDYQALAPGSAIISDQVGVGEFFGPLAGMLAALDYCDSDVLLTAPCDSPLLPTDYAQRMLRALNDGQADIAVASDGNRLQPVFSLLRTSLRDDLNHFLSSGGRKIDRWFEKHPTVVVDFADTPSMFRNVNTPEELAQLAQELD